MNEQLKTEFNKLNVEDGLTLYNIQKFLSKGDLKGTSDKILLHLIEELGELVGAYNKFGIYSKEFDNELADTQILLFYFAISTYTHLENVTIDKIRNNIESGKMKLGSK